MMFHDQLAIDDDVLEVLAHLPTSSLSTLVAPGFWRRFTDAHAMRLAVLLARKSHREGGCPIGAVIVDDETKAVVGKGHNTLVQEGHPYNHGETSAIRDAGRLDFSRTSLFTSLTPCDVCAALIYMRGFRRVVVGDITNAPDGNEPLLRSKGVEVEILQDPVGVALYAAYRAEKPDLDTEDWRGLAAVRRP